MIKKEIFIDKNYNLPQLIKFTELAHGGGRSQRSEVEESTVRHSDRRRCQTRGHSAATAGGPRTSSLSSSTRLRGREPDRFVIVASGVRWEEAQLRIVAHVVREVQLEPELRGVRVATIEAVRFYVPDVFTRTYCKSFEP